LTTSIIRKGRYEFTSRELDPACCQSSVSQLLLDIDITQEINQMDTSQLPPGLAPALSYNSLQQGTVVAFGITYFF
jgi:hypothetical protein